MFLFTGRYMWLYFTLTGSQLRHVGISLGITNFFDAPLLQFLLLSSLGQLSERSTDGRMWCKTAKKTKSEQLIVQTRDTGSRS